MKKGVQVLSPATRTVRNRLFELSIAVCLNISLIGRAGNAHTPLSDPLAAITWSLFLLDNRNIKGSDMSGLYGFQYGGRFDLIEVLLGGQQSILASRYVGYACCVASNDGGGDA